MQQDFLADAVQALDVLYFNLVIFVRLRELVHLTAYFQQTSFLVRSKYRKLLKYLKMERSWQIKINYLRIFESSIWSFVAQWQTHLCISTIKENTQTQTQCLSRLIVQLIHHHSKSILVWNYLRTYNLWPPYKRLHSIIR